MKTFFETIAVAFSLFSAIPMPRFEWDNRNMRYMLLGFPLVGAAVGGACLLWYIFCESLGLPRLFLGAGLTVLPVAVTGGIHMDGFVDTVDALSSHGDHEKKAHILRDPHIGAFAVIGVGVYYVSALGIWSALVIDGGRVDGIFSSDTGFYIQLVLSFVISRILSGMAVVSFPRTPERDLLHVFYDYADEKKVFRFLVIWDAVVSVVIVLTGVIGGAMVAVAHLIYLYYYRQCMREFGGVSGDQAGWFLVAAELGMAAVMVIGRYL